VTETGNALQSPVASILKTSCKISNHKIESNIINHFGVKLIKGYQNWISPFLPASCRFYPSCSQYALESYQKLGFWRATYLSLLRLLKCNPFHPGGVDAVPDAGLSNTDRVKLSENN